MARIEAGPGTYGSTSVAYFSEALTCHCLDQTFLPPSNRFRSTVAVLQCKENAKVAMATHLSNLLSDKCCRQVTIQPSDLAVAPDGDGGYVAAFNGLDPPGETLTPSFKHFKYLYSDYHLE